LADIRHYFYRGDTALHMAAAAFRRPVAELLVANGANCRARNRRGAEPLHYAADTNHWNPEMQAETITISRPLSKSQCLDDSGVAPLHRAVRTRSLAAVRALMDAGADPRQPNKAGSTPLHLAVQPTGRGGAGSPEALQQQVGIVSLLLERGARPTDRDGKGKQAYDAATGDGIRRLLKESACGLDHWVFVLQFLGPLMFQIAEVEVTSKRRGRGPSRGCRGSVAERGEGLRCPTTSPVRSA
jgi:hypothetical protein